MYKRVCVAGTFDELHAGHEAILRKAFAVGKHIVIGLTSDEFVQRFKSPRSLKSSRLPISSYVLRKQTLSAWLMTNGYHGRATIVPIDDPYEPAVSAKDVEALIVSEETNARGEELNRKREASGLAPIKLIVVPMHMAVDRRPLSSSRIRIREVDRVGNLVMPVGLRDQLAQPLGTMLSTPHMMRESFERHKRGVIVTVGDLTTKTLLDAGITPNLMIVDNKVERKAFPYLQPIFTTRGFHRTHVTSGPGFIAQDAVKRIRIALKSASTAPLVMEVDGEEDLLALPAITEALLGSVVYYGQPPVPAWACGPITQGVVEVLVTPEKKRSINTLLRNFSTT